MSHVAWDWRPDPGPWFDQLIERLEAWVPSEALQLDEVLLRRAMLDAASSRAPWLVHPCTGALTYPGAAAKPQRDFQMAVWIALNIRDPVGRVTLSEPMHAWSPDGGARVSSGDHDLAQLAEGLCGGRADIPVPLDPWSDSTKVPYHQLWRDKQPLTDDDRSELQADLRICLSSILRLKEAMPACLDWVCSRTKVIVPLRKVNGAHSSSSSSPELRGVVFLTLHHHVQALEALVHETAHQHLFMAEGGGPLVSPRHGDLYKSPLRSDPRPLRGILLAAHALAYMRTYYREAVEAELSDRPRLTAQLDEIASQYADARETLVGSYGNFTPAGRAFVDLTLAVGDGVA